MLDIDETPLMFSREGENTYLFPLGAKVSVKALRQIQKYKNTASCTSRREDIDINRKDRDVTSVDTFEQTAEERYLSNLAEGFKNVRQLAAKRPGIQLKEKAVGTVTV